jgi:hypothetical protein
MDPCHLEGLPTPEGRQDRRETAPEHCLARPGWTGEKEVVPTRSRELERTSAALLPADVGQVGKVGRRARFVLGRRRGRDLGLAAQIPDGLGDVSHADRLDAGERRLA